MRFLVKVSFPVEAGNAAAKKDGFKVIQTILEQQSKRCSAGTFRSGGGRMILGVDGGSDTCRFQSISICRSRSGALKCSRVWAGGEVGRARRRRRSSPRATAQARRSVPSRAVTG